MLQVDLEKFWAKDELSHIDNCFSIKAPQVALGIRMSDECVFAELSENGNPWGYTKTEIRRELNIRYNDKSEQIVGKRLLNENFPSDGQVYPEFIKIGEIFGGTYIDNGITTWLHSDIKTPKQLEKVLDRVNRLDIPDFITPKNFYDEKKRIFETYGTLPTSYRHIRGPVTLATTLFGVENLIFLILDEPDLSKYFSDTILNVIIKMTKHIDKEAGFTAENPARGFSFADDDCAMLTPEMYTYFAFPILKKVFELWAPNIDDTRFQHSDSDMGHLIPILAKLNLTACNFGPNISVSEIRKHMPTTRIDGQIAPFTFMNNDEKAIISEVKRDCEMIKSTGTKGLNISTAGSINNGSLLTSMRAVMFAIQEYGQY